jgi:hypothetical protein
MTTTWHRALQRRLLEAEQVCIKIIDTITIIIDTTYCIY